MLIAALAMIVVPYLPGRWRIVPWIVVALVGFIRIDVGAHNPLDVVGGVGLGVAIGGALNLMVGVPESTAGPDGGPGIDDPASERLGDAGRADFPQA